MKSLKIDLYRKKSINKMQKLRFSLFPDNFGSFVSIMMFL